MRLTLESTPEHDDCHEKLPKIVIETRWNMQMNPHDDVFLPLKKMLETWGYQTETMNGMFHDDDTCPNRVESEDV